MNKLTTILIFALFLSSFVIAQTDERGRAIQINTADSTVTFLKAVTFSGVINGDSLNLNSSKLVFSDVQDSLYVVDLKVDGTATIDALTGDNPAFTTKLTIDGNKSSNNLLEVINDDNGAMGDSSWAVTKGGGTIQQSVVVTDAEEYDVLPENSGKIHLIGNLTQNTSLDLPAEAAGLSYEFWYIGGAAEAHDHSIDSENNDNFFIGGVEFHDTDDGSATAVFSNGSSNSIFTINNASGGTIIKVICDGTNWYITGTVVSDTAPAFADQS